MLITCGPVDRQIFLICFASLVTGALILIAAEVGVFDSFGGRIPVLASWIGLLACTTSAIQLLWFSCQASQHGFVTERDRGARTDEIEFRDGPQWGDLRTVGASRNVQNFPPVGQPVRN